MNELPATVYILDRPYKLKVRPDDEHFLRKAAERIDAQAREYGKMYAYNDRQDLLAMVALTQITQLLRLQDREQFMDKELEARLTNINTMLDTKLTCN
ncbi:MAG: cell division protein ZapA [Bacteroidales bacterium]|jgi:cell division protein ZapA (FtsZ GTPase activity inhibitor)|nr:cell division protein ZapA [Bacteroidales bacterium]MBR3987625.1 cell division protein ZapA [Bacteroidales bacterium]